MRHPRTDYRFVKPVAPRTLPVLRTTMWDRTPPALFSCGHTTAAVQQLAGASGRDREVSRAA